MVYFSGAELMSLRRAGHAKPADSAPVTAPTSAHLHEDLTTCLESGRSIAVIDAKSPTGARGYLETHDPLTQVAVVAASIL